MRLQSDYIKSVEVVILGGVSYQVCGYNRNLFDEEAWEEFLAYDWDYRKSLFPDEPVPPDHLRRRWFTDVSQEYLPKRFMVLKEEEKLVARLSLNYYTELAASYRDNQNTAELYIDVSPDERRKGLGSYLMGLATKVAFEDGKVKFQSEYISEDAGLFSEKWGLKIASARHLNRLYLSQVDWLVMTEWASGYDVHVYSKIPNRLLDEFCDLYTACGKMAPDYDGDYTACEQVTPDSRKRSEALFKAEGGRELIGLVWENDKLIGLTELAYYKDNPSVIYQGLTGVLMDYRGKGYGKALKAQLVKSLMMTNDKAEYIETGNNDRNHAMVAINRRMGFKSHSSHFLTTGDIREIMKNL